MAEISAQDLKSRIDAGDDFKLVAVLTEWGFEAKHIRTSIRVSGMEDADGRISPNDEIVVYCSDVDCAASTLAVRLLEEAGYRDVTHFKGGLAGWEDAGYPLEGTLVD